MPAISIIHGVCNHVVHACHNSQLLLQSPHLALHTLHIWTSQLDIIAHASRSFILQVSICSCHKCHLAAFTKHLVHGSTFASPCTIHTRVTTLFLKSTLPLQTSHPNISPRTPHYGPDVLSLSFRTAELHPHT